MKKKKKTTTQKNKKKNNAISKFINIEEGLKQLSNQELKELLMINNYKLALSRAQIAALTEILIKKKIATYEEIWKLTHENFKDTKV